MEYFRERVGERRGKRLEKSHVRAEMWAVYNLGQQKTV